MKAKARKNIVILYRGRINIPGILYLTNEETFMVKMTIMSEIGR